jgi:hypothetical protein
VNRGYAPRQEVGYSNLLSLSLGNLALIWRQVLAYLVVAVVLGVGMPLFGKESMGLVGLLFYFAGQYWLFRSLLKARRLLQTQRIHFLAFVGLAALLIFPIMLGLAALLLPGLFLVSRWIAAPAFIVARGEGVFAAVGASWAAVGGRTVRVMGAIVVLALIVVAISGVLEGIGRALGGAGASNALDLVGAHLLPLVLLGLSVAAYQLLGPEDTMIEDVFG